MATSTIVLEESSSIYFQVEKRIYWALVYIAAEKGGSWYCFRLYRLLDVASIAHNFFWPSALPVSRMVKDDSNNASFRRPSPGGL
jgi:hypothetical protein